MTNEKIDVSKEEVVKDVKQTTLTSVFSSFFIISSFYCLYLYIFVIFILKVSLNVKGFGAKGSP